MVSRGLHRSQDMMTILSRELLWKFSFGSFPELPADSIPQHLAVYRQKSVFLEKVKGSSKLQDHVPSHRIHNQLHWCFLFWALGGVWRSWWQTWGCFKEITQHKKDSAAEYFQGQYLSAWHKKWDVRNRHSKLWQIETHEMRWVMKLVDFLPSLACWGRTHLSEK